MSIGLNGGSVKQRITGFDVARAIAVFGMVIVNFKIAMNANNGSHFLMSFAKLFEGRASALFVILAGIGLTLLTNKARHSADLKYIFKIRMSIIKRGLLLVVIGLMYTPIWEADILHFYGVYFLIAALLIMISDKSLLLVSFFSMLVFPILMLFFDYEQNWNWISLTYNNLWSIDGMIRHILFNGFHPVFPWVAFLIFGMWLGRQNLSQKHIRNKLLWKSIITLIVIEGLFYFARVKLGDGSTLGMSAEEVSFMFSTSMIPPLPQYILSAGSSAVIILIGCLYLSERFPASYIHKCLCQTGQMALTLYVAHVIIGMGFLEYMGLLTGQTIDIALLSAFIFCLCGVIYSVIWLNYFKVGPLEWIFRKITG